MILYKCDPYKNKTCAKTSCQVVCFLTRNKDYASCDPDGDPIIEYCDGNEQGDDNEQAPEKEEV